MALKVVTGTATPDLAWSVAAELGIALVKAETARFPDGELRPVVGAVRGDDVFIVQSTGPPVSENLLELLLLADACRRGGADRITAVVPYFGYARQDRRGRAGEAVGAKLVADLLAAAGADRVVVVDPHTSALEAMFAIPVEMLTCVPVLVDGVRPHLSGDVVVVAPDLGAVKLAERFAALLGAPVAVVRKTRLSGISVSAEEVVGEVAGRPALIVDDMISTGATIEAAAKALAAHLGRPDHVVAAAHGPLTQDAGSRLAAAGLRRLVVTDSTPRTAEHAPPCEVLSIAPLLADALRRLHYGEPLDDLLVRG